MFGRPRCREWTPLATQQLRLRSLIQIVGYNIRPPEWCRSQCSFYLTLHHTSMSAPFYTSERISSPHPKWKEIDSEMTQSMSSTNVIIRIWCHMLHLNDDGNIPQDTVIQTWGVYLSGMRYIGANLASNFTSDCFKTNTLVFQMHGGYFCSYKSLKLDIIPHENELDPGSLSSESSGRTNLSRITLESKLITSHKAIGGGRSISPNKLTKGPDKEYSKSHSPVDRGFQKSFSSLRQSKSINIGHSKIDRRFDDSIERPKESKASRIYEHLPENLNVEEFTDVNCDIISKNASQDDLCDSKIDLSETAESYDLRNEADGVPRYRYMAINFLKSEIRPSYNATKLQKLHILQYSIKKRQDAVHEIKEKIYKKSALTDAWCGEPEELLDGKTKAKSRSQRNLFSSDNHVSENDEKSTEANLKNGTIKDFIRPVSNGPRLTLKLNDLLTYKTKPSPFQRAEHVRLTKQLEILRFKRIILSDERDSKLANIRRLKERHSKLSEENQDVGLELMEDYHTLSRRTEVLRETRQSSAAMRELAARSYAALANRRCELLNQLHQIFYIEQREPSSWSIIGVPLPVCGDENPRANNPVRDSVAAGFVAQATCLAAALLNQPLRYKITLLGSATKILDVTPDLPDPNIPLFARGGDMTLFRYALFLMNKCIAQLLWGRGFHVTDIRPTLANLQTLLTTSSNICETSKLFGTYRWVMENQYPRTQSLRSLVASDRGKYRPFNRFKDSVDGQPPQSAMNLKKHRQSRSVGSYNDDQELPNLVTSTTSIMGSESNIYNIKLPHDTETETDSMQQTLISHNSDPAIMVLADVTPAENDIGCVSDVSYVIGDDEKLVRISTNNGDEESTYRRLDDNVKRICSEINVFCSGSNRDDVHRGFDIAKHMDTDIDIVKYMDVGTGDVPNRINDDALCQTCLENKDGGCDMRCVKNVTDVIVIPSAEAILDTGGGQCSDSLNSIDLVNS